MRVVLPVLALFGVIIAVSLGSCSGDSQQQTPDLTLPDTAMDPDQAPVDEPFGRSCELGKECKDADLLGFQLVCIGLEGGAEGKGFCTRSCSDVGGECFKAPNGQQARCFLQSNRGDAGPGEKFCGFLCKDKERVWGCPATLKCGEPSAEGVAICKP